jgi:hypothetical protein
MKNIENYRNSMNIWEKWRISKIRSSVSRNPENVSPYQSWWLRLRNSNDGFYRSPSTKTRVRVSKLQRRPVESASAEHRRSHAPHWKQPSSKDLQLHQIAERKKGLGCQNCIETSKSACSCKAKKEACHALKTASICNLHILLVVFAILHILKMFQIDKSATPLSSKTYGKPHMFSCVCNLM